MAAASNHDPDQRIADQNFARKSVKPVNVTSRSWPYLATPLKIYLAVMLPICFLQAFLVLTHSPAWMKWSSEIVLAFSVYALFRGYFRRLVVTQNSATLKMLSHRIEIPWAEVHRIGIYVPGGGVGAAQYFFITKKETPPEGKWDIDARTIQVQNRPGLLDEVRAFFPNNRSGRDARTPRWVEGCGKRDYSSAPPEPS